MLVILVNTITDSVYQCIKHSQLCKKRVTPRVRDREPTRINLNKLISWVQSKLQQNRKQISLIVVYKLVKKKVSIWCAALQSRDPTRQEAFEKKSPIEIIGRRKHTKRLFSDKEEYTLSKTAKLYSTSLAFPHNDKFDNKFHTCEEALEASIYQCTDLKVKVITKQPDKQAVVKNEKTYYKVECTVADRTNSIKLILWEDTIDKVSAGKSYLLQNVTVCSFVNTNETTVVQEVDEITDANTNTPGLQENHLPGQCVGIDIKKNMSCLVCNQSLPDDLAKEETIVCPHCRGYYVVITVKHQTCTSYPY